MLSFIPGIDSFEEAVKREMAEGSLSGDRTKFKPDTQSFTDKYIGAGLGGYTMEQVREEVAKRQAQAIEDKYRPDATRTKLATDGTQIAAPKLGNMTESEYSAALGESEVLGNLTQQVRAAGGTDDDLAGITTAGGLRGALKKVTDREQTKAEERALQPGRDALQEEQRQFNVTTGNLASQQKSANEIARQQLQLQIDQAKSNDERYFHESKMKRLDAQEARADSKENAASQLELARMQIEMQNADRLDERQYRRELARDKRSQDLVTALASLATAFVI